jgi:hypothetical protein
MVFVADLPSEIIVQQVAALLDKVKDTNQS